MSKKGKHYNLIITAIAREMAAYVNIAKEVVLTPVNPKLRLSRVPAMINEFELTHSDQAARNVAQPTKGVMMAIT